MNAKRRFLIATAWFFVASYLAYDRSFWGDEMGRLGQMRSTLSYALKSLFREPSPFAPGEIVLDWTSREIFSGLFSPEVWLRLPSVLWGAASVALAFGVSAYLGLLVSFSVSLTMFATEARPYAALIFSGALAFKIIWDRKTHFSRAMNVATWITLLFTHIYGICFIGFACFLRRQRGKTLLSALYVIAILSQFRLQTKGDSPLPSVIEIARQTLGTLGNPHKASLILAPLALTGLVRLFKRDQKLALELILLFGLTTLAPLYATLRSGYFFSPRQLLGGSIFFLAFAALGFETLGHKLSPKLAYALTAVTASAPWILCIAFRVPPFPNQPMHRYREIADRVVSENSFHSIFNIDPCNESTVEYYFNLRLGEKAQRQPSVSEEGLEIAKYCWSQGLCYSTLTATNLCGADPSILDASHPVGRIVKTNSQKFDVLLHSFERVGSISLPVIRSW